ncbi:MAG: hypothetical protein EOO41_05435, partial [Methanobacteriota archaeon]
MPVAPPETIRSAPLLQAHGANGDLPQAAAPQQAATTTARGAAHTVTVATRGSAIDKSFRSQRHELGSPSRPRRNEAKASHENGADGMVAGAASSGAAQAARTFSPSRAAVGHVPHVARAAGQVRADSVSSTRSRPLSPVPSLKDVIPSNRAKLKARTEAAQPVHAVHADDAARAEEYESLDVDAHSTSPRTLGSAAATRSATPSTPAGSRTGAAPRRARGDAGKQGSPARTPRAASRGGRTPSRGLTWPDAFVVEPDGVTPRRSGVRLREEDSQTAFSVFDADRRSPPSPPAQSSDAAFPPPPPPPTFITD